SSRVEGARDWRSRWLGYGTRRAGSAVPARSVRARFGGSAGWEARVVRSRAAEAGASAVRPAAKPPLRGLLSLRPLAPLDLSGSSPYLRDCERHRLCSLTLARCLPTLRP